MGGSQKGDKEFSVYQTLAYAVVLDYKRESSVQDAIVSSARGTPVEGSCLAGVYMDSVVLF